MAEVKGGGAAVWWLDMQWRAEQVAAVDKQQAIKLGGGTLEVFGSDGKLHAIAEVKEASMRVPAGNWPVERAVSGVWLAR